MNKDLVKKKVEELVAAQSCYPELKKAGEEWLASIGKDNEKEKLDALLKGAEECKSPIDACIGFLKSDMGKQIYGASVDAVLKEAEDKKAQGEDTCICPACQACKAILNECK